MTKSVVFTANNCAASLLASVADAQLALGLHVGGAVLQHEAGWLSAN